MKRILTVAATMALLAACDQTTTGAPASPSLDVTVLELEASGAFEPVAAVSDRPIDLGVLGAVDPQSSPESPQNDRPGMSYVAVNGRTGCRAPDDVEVVRDGDELNVEWVGGTDHEECAAPYNPVVHFAVRSSTVEGVRRVNGIGLSDPDGPAKPTGFVELSTLTGAMDLRPVTFADKETLYQKLVTTGAENLDEARQALEAPVPSGSTGYAFALPGCAEDQAVMVITERSLNAELVGGEDTNCDAPVYFLATFELADDKRPPGAKLGEQP